MRPSAFGCESFRSEQHVHVAIGLADTVNQHALLFQIIIWSMAFVWISGVHFIKLYTILNACNMFFILYTFLNVYYVCIYGFFYLQIDMFEITWFNTVNYRDWVGLLCICSMETGDRSTAHEGLAYTWPVSNEIVLSRYPDISWLTATNNNTTTNSNNDSNNNKKNNNNVPPRNIVRLDGQNFLLDVMWLDGINVRRHLLFGSCFGWEGDNGWQMMWDGDVDIFRWLRFDVSIRFSPPKGGLVFNPSARRPK